MKYPKYSCSACGKPSSRKWKVYRHISNCHVGIGNCVLNWDFPVDAYRRNNWEKGAMNQKDNSHYIRPDLMKQFLSSNELKDRKPFLLEELAQKMVVSIIQPRQSRISLPFSPAH
jgi:hypothetical protein